MVSLSACVFLWSHCPLVCVCPCGLTVRLCLSLWSHSPLVFPVVSLYACVCPCSLTLCCCLPVVSLFACVCPCGLTLRLCLSLWSQCPLLGFGLSCGQITITQSACCFFLSSWFETSPGLFASHLTTPNKQGHSSGGRMVIARPPVRYTALCRGGERGRGRWGEKGMRDKLQDDGVVFCTWLVVVHFTADWWFVSIIEWRSLFSSWHGLCGIVSMAFGGIVSVALSLWHCLKGSRAQSSHCTQRQCHCPQRPKICHCPQRPKVKRQRQKLNTSEVQHRFDCAHVWSPEE